MLFAIVGGFVGAFLAMAGGAVLPLGAQTESHKDWQDGYFNNITCRSVRLFYGEEWSSDRDGEHFEMKLTPIALEVKVKGGRSVSLNNRGVSVSDERDSRRAALTIDEHGGLVTVFGKGNGGSRVTIGVNEYGNGAVSTWDKNGYRLANLK